MLIVGHFVHEREEEGDEITVPDVQVDVLVFLGLEEGDGMDFQLAEVGAVDRVQQAMQGVVKKFCIEPGDELRDLFLRNGRGQVNVPGGEAGESLGIAGEQPVQKGRPTAQVPQDK